MPRLAVAPRFFSSRAIADIRWSAASTSAGGRSRPASALVPAGSSHSSTLASFSATSRRRRAAVGSVANTARRTAARSSPVVCRGALARTWSSTARAAPGSRAATPSMTVSALGMSIHPRASAPAVPGRSARRSARSARFSALRRVSVSAQPSSSGTPAPASPRPRAAPRSLPPPVRPRARPGGAGAAAQFVVGRRCRGAERGHLFGAHGRLPDLLVAGSAWPRDPGSPAVYSIGQGGGRGHFVHLPRQLNRDDTNILATHTAVFLLSTRRCAATHLSTYLSTGLSTTSGLTLVGRPWAPSTRARSGGALRRHPPVGHEPARGDRGVPSPAISAWSRKESSPDLRTT